MIKYTQHGIASMGAALLAQPAWRSSGAVNMRSCNTATVSLMRAVLLAPSARHSTAHDSTSKHSTAQHSKSGPQHNMGAGRTGTPAWAW